MSTLFVVGGARSGKSRYAQRRCEAIGQRLVYIATAHAGDDEMAERIARHRADRGLGWTTLEEPIDLPRAIRDAARDADAILVDCLTLWLSNVMQADQSIALARGELAEAVRQVKVPLVLIANELGLGIVPENALARQFRDEAGWVNQTIAQVVEEVVLVTAGLPLCLKGCSPA